MTALGVPERLGGDGVGLPELATALTEIGRHGIISPALATSASAWCRCSTWHPTNSRIATWRRRQGAVLTAALNEPGAPLPDRPVSIFANGRLNGTKVGVPYAGQADWMLVTADSAVVVVSPKADGVQLTKTPTSNGGDEYTVTFSDVAVPTTTCWRGPAPPGEPAGLATLGAYAAVWWPGAAADRRLCRQPPPVRQAAVDVPDRRGTAGRGLHRFADNQFGGDVGRLAAREGRDADDDLDVLGYWFASQAPPVMQTCHHLHGGMGVDITYPMTRYYSTIKDLTRLVGGPSHRLDLVGAQCSSI